MGELISNIRAALQEKIETQQLDGRADQEGARSPSSRPSIRASATRPNISIIRRSR